MAGLIGRSELRPGLIQELDDVETTVNNINTNVTTINNYINEDTSQYKANVLTTDEDGNILTKEYRRKTDNSLAILATNSNPDSNGYYQTLNCKYYKTDGTIDKTIEYHFTFLDNGLIKTSDGGVLL